MKCRWGRSRCRSTTYVRYLPEAAPMWMSVPRRRERQPDSTLTTRLAPAGNEWAWVTDGTRMNGSKSELLAIDAVTASYQGGNAMRLVGNGAMEFVWQGLCSIAGGYVRRAYNSAQWDEVPCAFIPAAMRRPRACSSRHSGLVTALCAAVGIAFLLAPPPAFAQSTTLVSNLDQLSTLKPAAGIYAQGFRTGAHTAGYTIRNVQVRLAAGSVTSSTKTSVLIRQERNGEPGALVTALTTQTPLVDGVNTFAAPANTILNPQTNYFVTVNEATPPPTGAPGVPFVAGPRAVYELTGSREQSGADGWSIDDKRLFKNHLRAGAKIDSRFCHMGSMV